MLRCHINVDCQCQVSFAVVEILQCQMNVDCQVSSAVFGCRSVTQVTVKYPVYDIIIEQCSFFEAPYLTPLPLHHRITFKLCTLMHGIHHGHCPKYMKEMVLPVSTLPDRERLRSPATQNYDIRRVKLKFGERAFAVAAPKAWNSLPDSLKQTNDTVKFRKT